MKEEEKRKLLDFKNCMLDRVGDYSILHTPYRNKELSQREVLIAGVFLISVSFAMVITTLISNDIQFLISDKHNISITILFTLIGSILILTDTYKYKKYIVNFNKELLKKKKIALQSIRNSYSKSNKAVPFEFSELRILDKLENYLNECSDIETIEQAIYKYTSEVDELGMIVDLLNYLDIVDTDKIHLRLNIK